MVYTEENEQQEKILVSNKEEKEYRPIERNPTQTGDDDELDQVWAY